MFIRRPPSPEAVILIRCTQRLHYFSADTLLSVLTRGRTLGATLDEFRARLPVLLRRMEVPETWIAERMARMDEVVATRTHDRRRLGYIADAGRALEYRQDGASSYGALRLDRIEQDLADRPYGVSTGSWTSPCESVRALAGLETDAAWYGRFHEAGRA
jgi:hypothetical protein